MAAVTARRSRAFIGVRRRPRLARRDTPVAITATARERTCLIQPPVTHGDKYMERGIKAGRSASDRNTGMKIGVFHEYLSRLE